MTAHNTWRPDPIDPMQQYLNSIEKRKQWEQNNKHKRAMVNLRVYSLARGCVFVEDVYPDIVYERDNYICQLCKEPTDPKTRTIDHIIPASCKGEHSYTNCQTAHRVCNIRKGAKLNYALP